MRHGSELAEITGKKIRWTPNVDKQEMLNNFNEAVSVIQSKGEFIGTKHVPFGIRGSGKPAIRTEVDVYTYKHDNGNTYYLYNRTSDGKFVSAGQDTRGEY